jgi:hypothetical protein
MFAFGFAWKAKEDRMKALVRGVVVFAAVISVSGPSHAQQSTTSLPKCRDTQAQCVAKSVRDGYAKDEATKYCLRGKCSTQ